MLNIILIKAHKFQEVVNSQENLIIIEKIFQDISKQMLEKIYILNLGQLLIIALELKMYIWQKLKPKKIQNLCKITTKNKLIL